MQAETMEKGRRPLGDPHAVSVFQQCLNLLALQEQLFSSVVEVISLQMLVERKKTTTHFYYHSSSPKGDC
jgi:hypothetical protein